MALQFVVIDDFSREWYVDVSPDKTQNSVVNLKAAYRGTPLHNLVTYSDNGTEYQRTLDRFCCSLQKQWFH